MTSFGQYKLTTLVKRRSDITEQEFHQYWSEKHPIVVNDWLTRHGVVKYVQVSQPAGQSELSGMITPDVIKL
jgi:hypothetical protein